MKASLILVLLCSLVALATAAPSFGIFSKASKEEVKYKLNPHLGFAKYNAVRYEPLRELPLPAVAAAPAPEAPYPAPAPAGPYPPQV